MVTNIIIKKNCYHKWFDNLDSTKTKIVEFKKNTEKT